jgi:hypothetical protein
MKCNKGMGLTLNGTRGQESGGEKGTARMKISRTSAYFL